MAAKSVSRTPTGSAVAERATRALILASFLTSLGFSFIFPLLPLYVQELSGPGAATALWSGLALAATPLGGAVAAPFWGLLADRIGHRPMVLRAMASTMVTIGLTAAPDAPWQIVLLRGLTGVLGSFQPAAMGALASWSRPEDLARAISRLQMAGVVGHMVGPLIGGLLAAFFGIRFACLAAALVLALGTMLVARWFHEPPGRTGKLRGPAGEPFRPLLVWLPMLTLVAIQFTDSSFNPILPLLLAEMGGDRATILGLSGLATSLSAIAAAAGSALAGGRMRRGARRRTMVAAVGALLLLSLAATQASLPWGVIAVRVAVGGTVAGMAVAAYSLGGMATAPSQRGSAYGWLSSASMVGYAASPIVAGAMAAVDLRAVLAVDVVLCLAATSGWVLARTIPRTWVPALPAPSRLARPPAETPKASAPAVAVAGGVSALPEAPPLGATGGAPIELPGPTGDRRSE